MISVRREQTVRALADKEYRDAFVSSNISHGLGFQIRAMREKAPPRGWTQAELAARAGMKQARISQLERRDYDKASLTTLKRLASAFDVALIVKFAPFSELVDWTVNLSPEHLSVPSFDQDTNLAPASPIPEYNVFTIWPSVFSTTASGIGILPNMVTVGAGSPPQAPDTYVPPSPIMLAEVS